MPAITEKGTYRWKCVKYYQKGVKFAGNYFKNSSTRLPTGATPRLRSWTPLGDSRPLNPLWFCPPHPKPPSATYDYDMLLILTIPQMRRCNNWIHSNAKSQQFCKTHNTKIEQLPRWPRQISRLLNFWCAFTTVSIFSQWECYENSKSVEEAVSFGFPAFLSDLTWKLWVFTAPRYA